MNWIRKPAPEMTDGELESGHSLWNKVAFKPRLTAEEVRERADRLSDIEAELRKRGRAIPPCSR